MVSKIGLGYHSPRQLQTEQGMLKNMVLKALGHPATSAEQMRNLPLLLSIRIDVIQSLFNHNRLQEVFNQPLQYDGIVSYMWNQTDRNRFHQLVRRARIEKILNEDGTENGRETAKIVASLGRIGRVINEKLKSAYKTDLEMQLSAHVRYNARQNIERINKGLNRGAVVSERHLLFALLRDCDKEIFDHLIRHLTRTINLEKLECDWRTIDIDRVEVLIPIALQDRRPTNGLIKLFLTGLENLGSPDAMRDSFFKLARLTEQLIRDLPRGTIAGDRKSASNVEICLKMCLDNRSRTNNRGLGQRWFDIFKLMIARQPPFFFRCLQATLECAIKHADTRAVALIRQRAGDNLLLHVTEQAYQSYMNKSLEERLELSNEMNEQGHTGRYCHRYTTGYRLNLILAACDAIRKGDRRKLANLLKVLPKEASLKCVMHLVEKSGCRKKRSPREFFALIEMLLKEGADPNMTWKMQNGNEMSLLEIAIYSGIEPLIKLFLKFKAEPRHRDLMFAASKYCHPGLLRELLNRGAEPGWQSAVGAVALHHAAYNPFATMESIELLWNDGALLNHTDNNGVSPMDLVILRGDTKLFRQVVAKYMERLPEEAAMTFCHRVLTTSCAVEKLRILVELGVAQKEAERQLTRVRTPFHTLAGMDPNRAMRVAKDAIPLLVEAGFDMDRRVGDPRGQGDTAYLAAGRTGNFSAMHYLLMHGANTDLVDREGKTGYQLYLEKARPEKRTERGEEPNFSMNDDDVAKRQRTQ